MANTEVLTNGYVGHFAGPDSAISSGTWSTGPSLAELSALINYSAGIRADGTDFNVEASEQVEDRSFADKAGAQSRGFASAGGNIEVFTPGAGDTTSAIALAYDALSASRTKLAYLQRFVKAQGAAIAAGDEVNIFRVITDERQHNRNDASRSVGVGAKLQDNLFVNYVVPASTAAAPTLTPSSGITTDDETPLFLKVTYGGRNITVGAKYTSANEAVFKVTNGGIIIPVAAGTANLTVSYPGAAAFTPVEVVITEAE